MTLPPAARFLLLECGVWTLTLVFVVLRLWPALIEGDSTFAHDNLYWGFPYYKFYAEELLAGRFTLWNPFSHGGESLITAYLQLRLFDPLTVLTTAVAALFTDGAAQLFSWDRLVRTYLGCFGTYLLIRREVASPLVRLSLIPVVCLSSLALNSFHQNALADQYYCAVFSIYFLLRILQDGDYRWRNWVGLAVFFGVSIQSYFFTGGALAMFWLLLGALLFRRHELLAMVRAPENRLRAAAAVSVIALMAVPMAVYVTQMSGELAYPARYLPPNWMELAPAGGPFYIIGGYEADAFRSLFMPYAVIAATGTNLNHFDFLTLWTGARYFPAGEAALFIGTLPFAIAIFGIAFGRHPYKRVWLTLLFGMALLGLGRDGALHNVLYYVLPPLWFVRHTHGLTPFILLPLLFFYAIGLARLLELRSTPSDARVAWQDLAALLLVMFATMQFVGHRENVASQVLVVCCAVVFPMLALPAKQLWYLRGAALIAAGQGLTTVVVVVFGASLYAATLSNQRMPWQVIAFSLTLLLAFLLLLHEASRRADRPDPAKAVLSLQVGLLALLVVALCAAFHVAMPSMPTSIWRRPVLVGLSLLLFAYLALRHGMARPVLLAATWGSLAVALAMASSRKELAQDLLVALLPLVAALLLGNRLRVPALYAVICVTTVAQLALEFWVAPDRLQALPERTRLQVAETMPLSPRRTIVLSEENRRRGQLIRSGELLERVPAALDPLMGKDGVSTPAPDPTGAEFGKVKDLGLWNSFAYHRQYAALVFSGLDPAILKNAFLIDELPLRFYRQWTVAPDFVEIARRSAYPVVLEKQPQFVTAGKPLAPNAIQVLDYRGDELRVRVTSDAAGVLYFADGYDPAWKATVNGIPAQVIRANGNFKAVPVPAGEHVVHLAYRPTTFLAALALFEALFVGGLLLIAGCGLRKGRAVDRPRVAAGAAAPPPGRAP